MAESNTYMTRGMGKRGSAYHARIDVTDAMSDFENGVANSRVLKGAAVKAVKEKMLPQIIANYGGASGGPKRVTGALSAAKSSSVKGLWYKSRKIAVAIGGLKTKNRSIHTINTKKKSAHRMEKWHANLNKAGQGGMFRVDPGVSVREANGRGTILNKSAWRIHSGVEYKMGKSGKLTSSIQVTRNPSRIAHLIEKGHRFARGGGNAKAYEPIEKAQVAKGRSTQSAMMHEIKKRATKQAQRVAAKVGGARAAQRAGVEL